MSAPYQVRDYAQRRKLALEVLSSEARMTRKAGSFLGQCAVDDSPLSPAQLEWLTALAERAGVAVEA